MTYKLNWLIHDNKVIIDKHCLVLFSIKDILIVFDVIWLL